MKIMKKFMFTLTILIIGIIFSGCGQHKKRQYKKTINVDLQAKSNSKVSGTIKLVQKRDHVLITTNIKGLTPKGLHGFHIHEKGDCSSEDGKSAGGHFSPNKNSHGSPDHTKYHAGDLGNLKANKQGEAKTTIKAYGISLDKAKNNSALNRAFIIHAKKDDFKSQPSGAAGKRIACGVIKYNHSSPCCGEM